MKLALMVLFVACFSIIEAGRVTLLTNHVYHYLQITLTLNLSTASQSPPFNTDGTVTVFIGNCSCPSWPTRSNRCSGGCDKEVAFKRTVLKNGVVLRVEKKFPYFTANVNVTLPDELSVFLGDGEDHVRHEHDHGRHGHDHGRHYRDPKVQNRGPQQPCHDDKRSSRGSRKPCPDHQKSSHIFIENAVISVRTFKQDFTVDKEAVLVSEDVKRYEYPDVKGNPILRRGEGIVLEAVQYIEPTTLTPTTLEPVTTQPPQMTTEEPGTMFTDAPFTTNEVL